MKHDERVSPETAMLDDKGRPIANPHYKRYNVVAGRQIYADGQPFVSIGREGETQPTDADEACRIICDLLNSYT